MLTPEQCAEIRRRSDGEWLAKYHAKHARFGGVSREFHMRAETYIRDVPTDIAALLATVEALRAELADVLAERDAMQALATQSGRELAEAVELLQRAVKYATEDRAVTPGVTRLARLLDKASAFLARHGGAT